MFILWQNITLFEVACWLTKWISLSIEPASMLTLVACNKKKKKIVLKTGVAALINMTRLSFLTNKMYNEPILCLFL